MKVKVNDGTGSFRTIECDSFEHRESGFIVVYRYDKAIALFGPGFNGYVEIEHDHYDRGS